ncbi:RidA family protein [Porphyrobacter algicida]|uniref:RidA family protein n=1 Tax=Qipengyuania algicida TaxID=1836209 RepID=A0A845AKA2_9SPHN|nr:RidA family protein [Qipengyuania algicida]MXP29285.1 RidA family protein [Qipengyuania algicida]
MANKRINPASLYDSVSYGFSHAVLSEGGRTLHLAGQVAWDKDCNIVGAGDLTAQTHQALANLQTVLEEVGAGPDNIVRLRTYVVDHSPDKLALVLPAIGEFYGNTTPAPNTFLGVAALALPDFLVEIEATAVID